jgi:hypothetical protein
MSAIELSIFSVVSTFILIWPLTSFKNTFVIKFFSFAQLSLALTILYLGFNFISDWNPSLPKGWYNSKLILFTPLVLYWPHILIVWGVVVAIQGIIGVISKKHFLEMYNKEEMKKKELNDLMDTIKKSDKKFKDEKKKKKYD